MMKKRISVLLIVFGIFLVQSCSIWDDLVGNEDDDEKDDKVNIETEDKDGFLIIDDSSRADPGNFEVITLTNSDDLDDDGGFKVKGNLSDKFQILIFKKPQNDLPVYIGIYDPVEQKVTANDTTTALALTLLNPYLVYTTQTQRLQYIEAVRYHQNFSDLLMLLNEAYKNDPDNVLNYDVNPKIYQMTVTIMKGVMENMGGFMKSNFSQNLEPPAIEDVTGTKINFSNPRRIYYAAGIYENQSLNDIVSVEKSGPVTAFNWGWPPTFYSDPTQSEYDLGDGTFDITMLKGVDYSIMSNWDSPVGRATKMNTGQAILYFMDLLSGFNIMLDFQELSLSTTTELEHALKSNVNEKDTEEFITNFCNLMYNNSDNISKWLLGAENESAEQFIESCTMVLKNAVFVFRLMGFVNENGPFYWEFVNAPSEVHYNVTQNNGNITDQQQNNPPMAEFTITPPAGIIGTEFHFSADPSMDDIDGKNLSYRWDFNSNGTWDVDWSTDSTQIVTYNDAGSYLVTLEVKDNNNLVSAITHRVNVGGGAGTATHVKLFQDGNPWSSTAMMTMLDSLGFTEGPGSNQYELIPSNEMATVDLIPGTDLVIIANDQNDSFYANYAANQVRFNNFVYMGGSLFWEACDRGWAYGNMVDQGVVLPGNIVQNHNYDYDNYVTDQNLPLVSGLPNEMDHNYASHESFTNLKDGTTIYCIDSYDRPTLIEYNLGGGWIIVTGQPLEHQYDNIYGDPDMEQLLPRIVSYFTGKNMAKQLPRPLPKKSIRASSFSGK